MIKLIFASFLSRYVLRLPVPGPGSDEYAGDAMSGAVRCAFLKSRLTARDCHPVGTVKLLPWKFFFSASSMMMVWFFLSSQRDCHLALGPSRFCVPTQQTVRHKLVGGFPDKIRPVCTKNVTRTHTHAVKISSLCPIPVRMLCTTKSSHQL